MRASGSQASPTACSCCSRAARDRLRASTTSLGSRLTMLSSPTFLRACLSSSKWKHAACTHLWTSESSILKAATQTLLICRCLQASPSEIQAPKTTTSHSLSQTSSRSASNQTPQKSTLKTQSTAPVKQSFLASTFSLHCWASMAAGLTLALSKEKNTTLRLSKSYS